MRKISETEEEEEPLLLLALNANNSVSWEVMEKIVSLFVISPQLNPTARILQARQVTQHLEKPVSELRGKLTNIPSISSPRRRNR